MSPLILLTLLTIGMFNFKYLRFLGHAYRKPPHPLVRLQDTLRNWRWEVLEVSGDLPRFQIQEREVPHESITGKSATNRSAVEPAGAGHQSFL